MVVVDGVEYTKTNACFPIWETSVRYENSTIY